MKPVLHVRLYISSRVEHHTQYKCLWGKSSIKKIKYGIFETSETPPFWPIFQKYIFYVNMGTMFWALSKLFMRQPMFDLVRSKLKGELGHNKIFSYCLISFSSFIFQSPFLLLNSWLYIIIVLKPSIYNIKGRLQNTWLMGHCL